MVAAALAATTAASTMAMPSTPMDYNTNSQRCGGMNHCCRVVRLPIPLPASWPYILDANVATFELLLSILRSTIDSAVEDHRDVMQTSHDVQDADQLSNRKQGR